MAATMEPIVFAPPASGSPGGYYAELALPDWFEGPAALRELLAELWAKREVAADDGFESVLDALGVTGAEDDAYRRGLWMGYALGLATLPHMRKQVRHDQRNHLVTRAVFVYLLRGVRIHRGPPEKMFPGAPAGWGPAEDVVHAHRSLLGALVAPAEARGRLRELLERCLEGEAVLSGDERRRDLYRWWLTRVVPAAQYERLPRVYTREWPWPPRPQRAEPPDRIVMQIGSEWAPDSPSGFDKLEIEANGRFCYENRFAGQVTIASGEAEVRRFQELAEHLREAGFPRPPPYDIYPGGGHMQISTTSKGEEEIASLDSSGASKVAGYAGITERLEEWSALLREGRTGELERLGFTVKKQS